MNISKMNNDQLKFALEVNNNTLHSLRIGIQNWRNAMLNNHVETGEMTLLEFNKQWDAAQKQSQARIAEIEAENYEIAKLLQGGN